MAKPFFDRLKAYYMKVGETLRGEAEAASIFPNTTDIGMSRERIYAEFLRHHLPSGCNIFFGGFLFGIQGQESKQIDVIVTTDVCPQYNLTNRDGRGKTFTCVDGTLAVVSLKSNLDTTELFDALDNLASIPPKSPLENRVMPLLTLPNYEDWPYKIIYAPKGISLQTLGSSLQTYYQSRPEIPYNHRPNLIHVAGQYNIVRIRPGGEMTRNGTPLQEHTFHGFEDSTDVFGLIYAVQNIQRLCVSARHILFNYDAIIDGIPL